jgi:predicted component of type VI protein secretion system
MYKTMMTKNTIQRFPSLLLVSALLLVAFTATGCDSTEPDDHGAGDEELITRIQLTLTAPQSPQVVAEATDPDGDGANLTIGTLVLKAGVTYSGTIGVFDDVNGENVGAEIDEEADEHQFFFIPGGQAASRLSIAATDSDSNGLPVGLTFTLATTPGGAGQASLRVILSHFDDDPKDGVSQSDETDIDVTFPVTIQP